MDKRDQALVYITHAVTSAARRRAMLEMYWRAKKTQLMDDWNKVFSMVAAYCEELSYE